MQNLALRVLVGGCVGTGCWTTSKREHAALLLVCGRNDTCATAAAAAAAIQLVGVSPSIAKGRLFVQGVTAGNLTLPISCRHVPSDTKQDVTTRRADPLRQRLTPAAALTRLCSKPCQVAGGISEPKGHQTIRPSTH